MERRRAPRGAGVCGYLRHLIRAGTRHTVEGALPDAEVPPRQAVLGSVLDRVHIVLSGTRASDVDPRVVAPGHRPCRAARRVGRRHSPTLCPRRTTTTSRALAGLSTKKSQLTSAAAIRLHRDSWIPARVMRTSKTTKTILLLVLLLLLIDDDDDDANPAWSVLPRSSSGVSYQLACSRSVSVEEKRREEKLFL